MLLFVFEANLKRYWSLLFLFSSGLGLILGLNPKCLGLALILMLSSLVILVATQHIRLR